MVSPDSSAGEELDVAGGRSGFAGSSLCRAKPILGSVLAFHLLRQGSARALWLRRGPCAHGHTAAQSGITHPAAASLFVPDDRRFRCFPGC